MPGHYRLNSGGSNFAVNSFNALADALDLLVGSAIGRGVISGLELSIGDDLEVDIAAGAMTGLKAVELDAQSFELPASSTGWVWIEEDGTPQFTATYTDPGGTAVCLGYAETDADSVTLVSTDGRMLGLRREAFNVAAIGQTLFGLADGRLEHRGAVQVPVRTITEDEVLQATDLIVLVDATADPVTLSLPPAGDWPGRMVTVKKTDAGGNAATIAADGAEEVEGGSTLVLAAEGDVARLVSEGSAWWTI